VSISLTPELIAGILAGIAILIPTAITLFIKIPKRLKTDRFMAEWKEIQGLCKDKTQWPQAISAADKLLDRALKRRKLKGKSMGERMVSAQRMFTNNDVTWFGHNLAKRLASDPGLRLRENDVKNALIGFRQALRDLGALDDGQPRDA
jgi:hypothetical protein